MIVSSLDLAKGVPPFQSAINSPVQRRNELARQRIAGRKRDLGLKIAPPNRSRFVLDPMPSETKPPASPTVGRVENGTGGGFVDHCKSVLREAAIGVRHATITPMRRRRLGRLASAGLAPPMVVFYHRVADTHPNDWTLDCRSFDAHIRRITRTHRVVDLAQVQSIVRGDEPADTRPACALTFDDGYAENARHALPLLVERQLPVTYFVCTGNIRSGRPFGHDAAEPLAVHTPADLRRWADAGVEIGGHTRDHIDCGEASASDLQTQIIDDKDQLEQMIGRAVRFFAFPFGTEKQLTRPAIEAVRNAGYQGFCSAYGGYNTIGGDAFHIRRFHGDPDPRRLENWLSFDPSKLREPNIPTAPISTAPNSTAPILTATNSTTTSNAAPDSNAAPTP